MPQKRINGSNMILLDPCREFVLKENTKNYQMYYKDIMNMFNPQNTSPQNFVDLQKFYPANNNNMIENGDASSTGVPRSVKEELKDFTMKRRDSKLLRSPSPIHHDAWKRVTGMNSRPSTPSASLKHKDFSADNISDYSQFNIHEKVPHMYIENNPIMSRAESIISDFDHVKSKEDLDSVI